MAILGPKYGPLLEDAVALYGAVLAHASIFPQAYDSPSGRLVLERVQEMAERLRAAPA